MALVLRAPLSAVDPPSSASSDPCRSLRRMASVTRPVMSAARPSSSASSLSSTGGWASSCRTRVPTRSASSAPIWSPTVNSDATRSCSASSSRTSERAEVARARKRPGVTSTPRLDGHHLLELVGLVEDDHVVLGQHGPPAGQVGPVEVGVDHHHVGRRRAVPGRLGEAAVARGAVEGPRALAGADADHAPGPGAGLEAQIGPVAARRALGPGQQGADLVDQAFGGALGRASARVRPAGLERLGLVPGVAGVDAQLGLDPPAPHLGHPLAADVVAPALEHGVGEGEAQPALDQGQVLLGQLVLQRLGGGGHHHLLAAEHGRHQVGQRLPGPGPGLDDEVGAGDERLADGAAHLLLLGALLAVGHLRRDLGQGLHGVVAGLAGRAAVRARRAGVYVPITSSTP